MSTTQPTTNKRALELTTYEVDIEGGIDVSGNADFWGANYVKVGTVAGLINEDDVFVPVQSFFPFSKEMTLLTKSVPVKKLTTERIVLMQFRKSFGKLGDKMRYCVILRCVDDENDAKWNLASELNKWCMPKWKFVNHKAACIAREVNAWIGCPVVEDVPAIEERVPAKVTYARVVSRPEDSKEKSEQKKTEEPAKKAPVEFKNGIQGLDSIKLPGEDEKAVTEAPAASAEPKRPKAKKDRGKKLSWDVKSEDAPTKVATRTKDPASEPKSVPPPSGETVSVNLGSRVIELTESELMSLVSYLFQATKKFDALRKSLASI